uniref:Uncharacterized protein n=1 Tax=Knipowitschia caucasica TaxID=637954 RepID=A0AAV2L4Q9_KNICA
MRLYDTANMIVHCSRSRRGCHSACVGWGWGDYEGCVGRGGQGNCEVSRNAKRIKQHMARGAWYSNPGFKDFTFDKKIQELCHMELQLQERGEFSEAGRMHWQI